jgi:hypothetical protein
LSPPASPRPISPLSSRPPSPRLAWGRGVEARSPSPRSTPTTVTPVATPLLEPRIKQSGSSAVVDAIHQGLRRGPGTGSMKWRAPSPEHRRYGIDEIIRKTLTSPRRWRS